MAKKVTAEFCSPPRSQHWRDRIKQRPNKFRQCLRWLRTKFL